MTDMFKKMGYNSPDLAIEQNNFVKIADTHEDHVRGGNFDDGNTFDIHVLMNEVQSFTWFGETKKTD